jgi:UDP-N-acetylmuramoyl-L-alanyl-D-glutamate--2,6-diaminopimelate ligase
MDKLKKLIPQKLKNIYHLGQAILANVWYGFPARRSYARSVAGGPSKKIKIIGVTGTNGKTTTVQMIARILEEAGRKVAVASTINFKMNGTEEINKTKFTTLSSWAVQKFINKAVKGGCEYLVLETSSHSLDQYRTWGIEYDTAVITNVTREHLDYHETMEEYRKVKCKLFKNIKTAVVNLDMERPEEYFSYGAKNIFGYTCHPEHSVAESKDLITCLPAGRDSGSEFGMTNIIVAENIELGTQNTRYKMQDTNFILHLLGKFNIENALAATCVGLSEGISLEIIKRALGKIKLIPGRMENVENNKGLNIIVDYAVTPDSLEKLYQLISQIKNPLPLEKGDVRRTEEFEKQSENFKSSPNPSFSKGGEHKVIAVFGSCGERDRGKRPIMGKIVSKFADYIIITNEDPYGENPEQIINEVFSGIPLCYPEFISEPVLNSIQESKEEIPDQVRDDISCFTENVNCWRILERREAIKKALQMAEPGDFVIVTGKGAEETMAIGKKRISWNDKKVIQEVLQEL